MVHPRPARASRWRRPPQHSGCRRLRRTRLAAAWWARVPLTHCRSFWRRRAARTRMCAARRRAACTRSRDSGWTGSGAAQTASRPS
eukprot:249808-Chlamydomonas_euryale.AAC.1